EAPQPLPQRRHRWGFARRAEALQIVVVDQHGEIVEAMMAGEDERFPRRAFLPFAVGGEADDARIAVSELESDRRTRGERKPRPQAARRERDIVDAVTRRMSRQKRVVLVEQREVLVAQAAERP